MKVTIVTAENLVGIDHKGVIELVIKDDAGNVLGDLHDGPNLYTSANPDKPERRVRLNIHAAKKNTIEWVYPGE